MAFRSLVSLFLILAVACGAKSSNGQETTALVAGSKRLPLPGESFKLNGNEAFVMLPSNVQHRTPWVWYAPTLPSLPGKSEEWMFEEFLKAGIAIAGIDVGESYGSPKGRKIYQDFYSHLVENRQFSRKPVLLARSRGGLMLYSWATKNPNFVGAIAGIYPVVNLKSYPGLDRASGAFGLTTEQLQMDLLQHNPVDRLERLAKAEVPVFHLHGDKDNVVPLDANSALLASRYEQLGGKMTLEVVKGKGHDMWPGWFNNKSLAEFVIANAQQAESNVASRVHPVPESELWLTRSGKEGPGKGKHVVLIAAEQEYRSEQSMPMLAKILADHHGFDCTVLFSVNEQGLVDPTLPAPFKDKTKRHRIPGLQYLVDADCVIWLSRFMQLDDEQIKHFHDYFDSGKPLIALRTANHGFWNGKKYTRNGEPISLRELLGGSFMGHHGGWHRESTRGIIVAENQRHPILTGVDNIWGTSDVYRCHNDRFPFPNNCTALVMGQPLINLEPDAVANEKKEPLPVAWTKTWTGNAGRTSRIFHFTMGSAEDFQNDGVRRLTVNAVYWGLGMESSIDPKSSVNVIDRYQPLKAGFNYEKLGVQPREAKFYE